MRISDVLRNKGGEVVTVTPETGVRELLDLLAEHRIGAVVVSRDGARVDGIVSERDVVRAMAERGADVLQDPVSEIHTEEVHTCRPEARIDDLMRLMTDKRVRHVPVLKDDALIGIVSIGDVVKSRIGELETERDSLNAYISTGP